jgi:hypothetical protein
MKYTKPYLKSMLLFNIVGLLIFSLCSILYYDFTFFILGILIVPISTLLSGDINATIDYIRSK